MLRSYSTPQKILDAKGSNGVGNAMYVKDWKNISIQYGTDGGGDAALTVKFQGSTQEDKPDFSASKSITNHWDYIQVINLNPGLPINGDTGHPVATADDYKNFEYNNNGLTWINVEVSGRTAGEVTVVATGFSD